MRQYCEKQEKEIVEEEVEESINKLTTFNLNTRKESEQEAKSALVKTPFLPYSRQHLIKPMVCFLSIVATVFICFLCVSPNVPGVAVLY